MISVTSAGTTAAAGASTLKPAEIGMQPGVDCEPDYADDYYYYYDIEGSGVSTTEIITSTTTEMGDGLMTTDAASGDDIGSGEVRFILKFKKVNPYYKIFVFQDVMPGETSASGDEADDLIEIGKSTTGSDLLLSTEDMMGSGSGSGSGASESTSEPSLSVSTSTSLSSMSSESESTEEMETTTEAGTSTTTSEPSTSTTTEEPSTSTTTEEPTTSTTTEEPTTTTEEPTTTTEEPTTTTEEPTTTTEEATTTTEMATMTTEEVTTTTEEVATSEASEASTTSMGTSTGVTGPDYDEPESPLAKIESSGSGDGEMASGSGSGEEEVLEPFTDDLEAEAGSASGDKMLEEGSAEEMPGSGDQMEMDVSGATTSGSFICVKKQCVCLSCPPVFLY